MTGSMQQALEVDQAKALAVARGVEQALDGHAMPDAVVGLCMVVDKLMAGGLTAGQLLTIVEQCGEERVARARSRIQVVGPEAMPRTAPRVG